MVFFGDVFGGMFDHFDRGRARHGLCVHCHTPCGAEQCGHFKPGRFYRLSPVHPDAWRHHRYRHIRQSGHGYVFKRAGKVLSLDLHKEWIWSFCPGFNKRGEHFSPGNSDTPVNRCPTCLAGSRGPRSHAGVLDILAGIDCLSCVCYTVASFRLVRIVRDRICCCSGCRVQKCMSSCSSSGDDPGNANQDSAGPCQSVERFPPK